MNGRRQAGAKRGDGRISRRDFIGRATTALAAFTIVPSHVVAGRSGKRPSDTVTRAVIPLLTREK